MEASARSLDGALCLGASVAVLRVNDRQKWRPSDREQQRNRRDRQVAPLMRLQR